MSAAKLPTYAHVQMGYHLIILNLFHCLHCKGVLPLSDAAQSLEEMERRLPTATDETSAAMRMIIRGMAAGLRDLSGEAPPPNPKAPPPPMRPNLRIIPGGRSD